MYSSLPACYWMLHPENAPNHWSGFGILRGALHAALGCLLPSVQQDCTIQGTVCILLAFIPNKQALKISDGWAELAKCHARQPLVPRVVHGSNHQRRHTFSATACALVQILEEAERSGLVQDDSVVLAKICQQLAVLPGQMVAEIELKRFLGLHDTRGHRAWRALRDKLLRGGFVAEVPATVEV